MIQVTIEPGERSLVISSNCRAFMRQDMTSLVAATHHSERPRRYSWWEQAVLRFYNAFFVGGIL